MKWMGDSYPEFCGTVIMVSELVDYPMWERFRDVGGYGRISRKLKKKIKFVEWDFVW